MTSFNVDKKALSELFQIYDVKTYLSPKSSMRREGQVKTSLSGSPLKSSDLTQIPRYDNVPLDHIINSHNVTALEENTGLKFLHKLRNIENRFCVVPSWPVLVDYIIRLCHAHNQSYETMLNTIECLRYSLTTTFPDMDGLSESPLLRPTFVSELDVLACLLVSSKVSNRLT